MGTYFTYWSGVAVEGVTISSRPHRLVYGWLTNDHLALIGVNWAIADFPAIRADIEGNYVRVLERAAPELAARVRAGRQEAKWIGGAAPNFFRTPYGPGWALVGDAGYHKDPITAQGIGDAFRDAELLAEALAAGFAERRPMAEALADYERHRNEAAMPMYEFTCQLAALEPPPPEMQQLFAALHGNQEQTDRFFGAYAGTVPIPEFFSPENIAHIINVAPDAPVGA
jgi:2-polyprenyl-6-methoxyphenol hydroxylase-like FAD-dependent oxidoreductase